MAKVVDGHRIGRSIGKQTPTTGPHLAKFYSPATSPTKFVCTWLKPIGIGLCVWADIKCVVRPHYTVLVPLKNVSMCVAIETLYAYGWISDLNLWATDQSAFQSAHPRRPVSAHWTSGQVRSAKFSVGR